jgi:hypothetical protein
MGERFINGRGILSWILKEWGMRVWSGLIRLRIEFSAGFLRTCENGNAPSTSLEDREFIDKLNDNKLLKKDSAPWS